MKGSNGGSVATERERGGGEEPTDTLGPLTTFRRCNKFFRLFPCWKNELY